MKNKIIFSIFYFFSIILRFSDSYRILSIFPCELKSHNIIFNALLKNLVKRGHEVDVITFHPLENLPSNYKVVVDFSGNVSKEVPKTVEFFKSNKLNTIYRLAINHGNDLCKLLGSEKMQEFIKSLSKKSHYDLVITEVSYIFYINNLNTSTLNYLKILDIWCKLLHRFWLFTKCTRCCSCDNL